jgi:hypothetical protein
VEYSSQFPLESFVSWYLSWAQDLLRRCSAERELLPTTTVKLIQVSGRSVDILINGEHKCSNDRWVMNIYQLFDIAIINMQISENSSPHLINNSSS